MSLCSDANPDRYPSLFQADDILLTSPLPAQLSDLAPLRQRIAEHMAEAGAGAMPRLVCFDSIGRISGPVSAWLASTLSMPVSGACCVNTWDGL